MRIITEGRTDLDDLFSISGIFSCRRLNHTPFLVFVRSGEDIRVEIVNYSSSLLGHADDTPVMVQWEGKWRSDFFQFKVGQYRAWKAAHEEVRA